MKAVIFCAAVAAAAPMFAHAESVEMPGGLWETKMKMDMPGMPPEIAAQMANRVMTNCVKPGERKWTDRQKGPMERGDKKCEQSDVKITGNTVSMKLTCTDGTTGDVTVTHNGKDTYKMDSVMNNPKMGGAMKLTVEGKKIADTCEKK